MTKKSFDELDADLPDTLKLTHLKKPQDACPARYVVDGRYAALRWRNVTITIEQITPERARCYQACVPEDGTRVNRDFRKANLKRLSRAVTEDRFLFNGDTIVFDEDNYLIDGKHRLQTCIDENATIVAVVVRGVSKESFATINIGTVKSFSDMLFVQGAKSANDLGAAIKIVDEYETKGRISESSEGYTPDLAPALLEKYSKIQNFAQTGHNVSDVITRSLGMALHYLFDAADKTLAAQFMHKLGTGIGISSESDPIYILRRALKNLRLKNTSDKAAANRKLAAAYVIKVWNATIHKKEVGHLRLLDNETFPVIADKRSVARGD